MHERKTVVFVVSLMARAFALGGPTPTVQQLAVDYGRARAWACPGRITSLNFEY